MMTPGSGDIVGAQCLRYWREQNENEPEALLAMDRLLAKAAIGLAKLGDFLTSLEGE